MFDIEPRGGPRAYTKTDRYRFLGDYGSSEDITGGAHRHRRATAT